MSDISISREALNLEDFVTRIRRQREESETFSAEQRKLSVEATKLAAEQLKLMAEAAKLDRERRFIPWVFAASIAGGVVAAALTSLPSYVRSLGLR